MAESSMVFIWPDKGYGPEEEAEVAAASRPRLSETEPKWFMFETSSYAFVKEKENKVNIVTV